MSYVRVDSSVPRNRKFVKAGPAPSWLWLCGLAYCQEGLTDGFIPEEALDFLGVKNPRKLAEYLERARLWDKVEGGWQVHDYLEHNKSAAAVRGIKAEKREAASRGGRASGETRRSKQSASEERSTDFNHSANPSVDVADSASVATPESKEKGEAQIVPSFPPMDDWLRELQQDYPQHRVTYGARTEHAFFEQFTRGVYAPAVWEGMQASLEAHKACHEWRVKGMVPKLENWLRDGLWRNTPQAAPPPMTTKTQTTLSAAADIMREAQ